MPTCMLLFDSWTLSGKSNGIDIMLKSPRFITSTYLSMFPSITYLLNASIILLVASGPPWQRPAAYQKCIDFLEEYDSLIRLFFFLAILYNVNMKVEFFMWFNPFLLHEVFTNPGATKKRRVLTLFIILLLILCILVVAIDNTMFITCCPFKVSLTLDQFSTDT